MTPTAARSSDERQVRVSNADKVLFPDSGITKGDLIDYYERIAGIALPHYAGRPLTMHRFPDGIGAEGFFQKDVPDYFPDWIERAELAKKDGTVSYLVANDAATLVYIANQGCITPHVGLSRADDPDRPDRLVFDLDPSDDDFAKVQRAAGALRGLLDDLGLISFVQVTGSRGLHIVVPLKPGPDFDEVRSFARDVAKRLAAGHPEELTVAMRKNKRGNRVFVDYLRNAYGQTSVAPYAVRAREGAPVATPINWHEAMQSGLGPRKYTVANIFRRVAQTGDPWADMEAQACSLKDAAKP